MLTYTMTPEDVKIVQNDLKKNKTLKHLADLSKFKFNVGDVLLCETRYSEHHDWSLRRASNGLPYRYMYVFENNLGIGYIRRLSVTGEKFVGAPICTVEFDPNLTRFQVDPNYENHILLADEGDSFDLKSEYKEIKRQRAALRYANRKIAEKVDTLPEAMAFLLKLKVGDRVWYGWSAASVPKQAYVVTAIETNCKQREENYVVLVPEGKYLASGTGAVSSRKEMLSSIIGKRWYRTKPKFQKEEQL